MPGSQPLRRPDGRGFQRVCEFSRVFEHVKAPKNPWTVERKKLIIIIIILTGLGPNNP